MIFLYVLFGWLFCGLLVVFLGGLHDRLFPSASKCLDESNLGTAFSLGPILLIFVIIAILEEAICFNRIIEKIYRLGKGK